MFDLIIFLYCLGKFLNFLMELEGVFYDLRFVYRDFIILVLFILDFFLFCKEVVELSDDIRG